MTHKIARKSIIAKKQDFLPVTFIFKFAKILNACNICQQKGIPSLKTGKISNDMCRILIIEYLFASKYVKYHQKLL